MSKQLESFPAMRAWDASFKIHHMPLWFKKCIRARYRAMRGPHCGPCYVFGELNTDWDHWGSVQRDGFRAVINQPYGQDDATAQRWADELGCRLVESHKGGPWHPGTHYYEFHPATA